MRIREVLLCKFICCVFQQTCVPAIYDPETLKQKVDVQAQVRLQSQ